MIRLYTTPINRYFSIKKKRGSDLFDASMGAYDGAKVCEVIATFLLNLL